MQLPQFEVHAATEDKHWWFLARREIVSELLRHISPKPEKIVDVGCGTGGNTAALAAKYDCLGIDPIPEAIAFAQERFPFVQFIQGYAPQDIEHQMQDADVVMLMDVLEHIEDDFLFVSELLASMKPGAHLLLMAPADPTLWGPHDKGFEHYRRYTTDRLRLLWKDLPVTERMVSYCNSRLYPLVKVARMISRMCGASLGPNDTDLSLPMVPINALFHRLFLGEKKRLINLLDGKTSKGFGFGVSVMAVVRREEGEIIPRKYPANVARDARPWMGM
ncbi:MAG: class I SAM-dependent methyltransferase [bacterium]|nr:class I SAM-dependent methyltransferase [bacterium]